MIKEGEDVAVVERGQELVLEGDETEESPCDSNKRTLNLALRIDTPKKRQIPLILGGYQSAVTTCADVKAP